MDRGPIEKSRPPVISIVPIKNTVKVQFDPAKKWVYRRPEEADLLSQLRRREGHSRNQNDNHQS